MENKKCIFDIGKSIRNGERRDKGMIFKEELEQRQKQIEELLKTYLPQEPQLQKTIFEAMEYSLMAGGKRLRPMMMQEAFDLFGGTRREILAPFMAAMEMIHTYSLVHDDLPAMDNDDYRRGRKTTHVVYGEDMGILAGDALLNYAYETAASAFTVTEALPQTTKAFQILVKKAGIYGMVGGQVVDVERTGQKLTEEELLFIYRLKTGALLEASLMVGATLAGASEEDVAGMEQVGEAVGMAFQIQDDILDCTSTADELGKPVHSDEKNDKTTYVALKGMEASRHAVEEYSHRAIALLQQGDRRNEFLTTLVEKLIYRKN